MPRDYVPAREASLVTFANNYSSQISTSFASLGLTAGQASNVASLTGLFVSAYNVVHNGSTRSPANIILKDQAKVNMVAGIRQTAGIIQKCPTVTNAQRETLGLTVHAQSSPIPPPAEEPKVDIVSVNGRTVRVKLHDGSGTKRGRPAFVAGAAVFSYVGSAPPANIEDWVFQGNVTKTQFDVVFDSSLAPGATVFITSFWYNAKAQSGPACNPPISVTFGAAGVSNVAA
jgi:hypothetical protein